jgi:hypothetical protein
VFKPSVLLALTAAGEQTPLLCEMRRQQFQVLRFQVAQALRQMDHVEALPILKIE